MDYNSGNINKLFESKPYIVSNAENNLGTNNCYTDDFGNSTERLQNEEKGESGKVEQTKKAIHYWAENTTFHGIKYVFDSRSSKFRRLVWFLIIAALWFGLIRTCLTQYNRYFDYETVTQDTFRLENKLTFPAISICNQCIMYNVTGHYEDYEMFLHLLSIRSKEDFEKLQELFGPRLKDNTSKTELITGLSTPASVFLNRCVWNFESINCSANWKAVELDRLHCFTLDSDLDGKPLSTKTIGRYSGGLSTTVFLDQESCLVPYGNGILLAVHEVGVEPNMYVSMNLAPGFHHGIGVTINENSFLPPPVMAFGTSECIDTESPDFVNPLKHYSRYSLSSCEKECMSVYVNETCGCISTTKPEQMKLCDVVTENTCAAPAYRTFWDNYNDNVAKCGCRERCQYTTYTTTVSSSNLLKTMIQVNPNITTREQKEDKDFIRDNFLTFDVYLNSKVIHMQKQILSFTLGDLGASIGGFFGLAIGASVLTFCEIFDMMITLTVRIIRNLGQR